ncbi:MAG: hypothetical protein KDB22_12040 [Planctomycetales bacterium]|nr:hypothetical protein [Planctomycetales bacterium]
MNAGKIEQRSPSAPQLAKQSWISKAVLNLFFLYCLGCRQAEVRWVPPPVVLAPPPADIACSIPQSEFDFSELLNHCEFPAENLDAGEIRVQVVDESECRRLAGQHSQAAHHLRIEKAFLDHQASRLTCELEKCASPTTCIDRVLQLRLSLLDLEEARKRSENVYSALFAYHELSRIDLQIQSLGKLRDVYLSILAWTEEIDLPSAALSRQISTFQQLHQDTLTKISAANRERQFFEMQLRRLIGLPLDDGSRLAPVVSSDLAVPLIDEDAEIERGTSARYELSILQSMLGALNCCTLAEARGVLAQFENPCTFTSALPSRRDEVEYRRMELENLAEEWQQKATGEIMSSCRSIHGLRRELAQLAVELEEQENKKLNLEQKRELGGATFVDVAEANIRELELEARILDRAVDLKLEYLRLRKSQSSLLDP